jgi:hypothetical protein
MPILVDIPASPGSSVDLCAIFINAAVDLADFVAVEYAGETIAPSTRADVEVRKLANRTRLIRRGTGAVATLESLQVTFERCTAEQVAWLRDHVGELVCIRDHVGGKFFGVYTDVPREVATAYRDRFKVTLSFDQVTYSEAT